MRVFRLVPALLLFAVMLPGTSLTQERELNQPGPSTRNSFHSQPLIRP